MDLSSSGVLENMCKAIEDHGFVWDVSWSSWLLESSMSGIAKFLAITKGYTPHAVVLKDNNDNVIFGALCEKQVNESGDEYTLSYFFGNKELPEATNVTPVSDPPIFNIIHSQCIQAHNLFFARPKTKYDNNPINFVLVILINCIKDFFNVHLLQDPNVTLSLENFFTIKLSGNSPFLQSIFLRRNK